MVGTILLALTEGFNDMALLANQVMLSENNFDVIISSTMNSAIKGEDSSVLAITLEEALSHGVDYNAVIVVGGNDIEQWDELFNFVSEMVASQKIVGALGTGIKVIEKIGGDVELSRSDEVVVSGKIITLENAELAENFVDKMLDLL
jgi:putative intracellular protease/amidase